MENRNEIMVRNLGLAQYLMENGMWDNFKYCRADRYIDGVLFYSFNTSDELVKLVEDYIAKNGELENTISPKRDKVFVITEKDIAKSMIVEHGLLEHLVAYRDDLKSAGNKVFVFNKAEDVYTIFQRLKGWIR